MLKVNMWKVEMLTSGKCRKSTSQNVAWSHTHRIQVRIESSCMLRKQICKKLWIPVTGSWTVHLKRRHRSSPRSTQIHVLKNGQALPMVFAMLPDNTAATYERLFRSVLQNKPELNPATVMTDFEAAARQAVSRVFPNAQIHGCLFHLGQSVWRRIQNDGLQQLYSEDTDFALHLRLLTALAFVPVADVETAFDFVASNFPAEAASVLDYFEDVYICQPTRRGKRRAVLFPPNSWNIHDCVVNDLPRTNNSVEDWHQAFQRSIGCHHPNL